MPQFQFVLLFALIGFLVAAFAFGRKRDSPIVTLLLAFQTGGLAGALVGGIIVIAVTLLS